MTDTATTTETEAPAPEAAADATGTVLTSEGQGEVSGETGSDGKDGSLLTGDPPQAKAADGADSKPPETQSGAPEEYADFTMREGIPVDNEGLGEFKGLAKDLGLTQAQAQRLVDFELDRFEANQQAAEQLRTEQAREWIGELRGDKEFGGPAYDETLVDIQAVLRRYGDDELKQSLNESGYGNFPPLVRFVARLSRVLSPDQIHGDTGGATGEVEMGAKAVRLFDKSNMNP